MLSFERCMNKCIWQVHEREVLIGLALSRRMFESYTNATQGYIRVDNPPDMISMKVDSIIQ